MPEKTFYIIDGHAQIFRAYFAPFRDLTSPSGEPTKATFVFTQWLMNLIERRQPAYLAMVIDSGDESVFRKAIDPGYKSNREPPPDDFHPQEDRIIQIVRDVGIPIFVKPGYEADDILATMAHRLRDQGYDIVLVSKDKDLRQLLNGHTRMYDMQADTFLDVPGMEQTLGYTPAEAVEVQTLMGDSTDNVLGIPGVGEKTAVKLVKKYGTADAVLNHLDELTPKMRENFEKYGSRLATSRQLVTLKSDVEIDFDAEKCRFKGMNAAAMRVHLEELGFHALLKKLGGEDAETARTVKPSAKKPEIFEEGLFSMAPAGPGPDIATSADCDYQLIDTEEKFAEFLKEVGNQKRFAFDTETDALGAMNSNLIGMSFSWKPKQGYYLPVRGPSDSVHLSPERVISAMRPVLEDPKVQKVGHNIKYDLMVMRQAGVNMRGIVLDSMIAAFLLDAGKMQYGIDRLALETFNHRKIATSELIGKGKHQISMDRVDLATVAKYASEDADIAWRLAGRLDAQLDEVPALRKLNDGVETPLISVLADMETNGIAINPRVLSEQSLVLGERIEKLREEIMTTAGCEFNPDSPKQLAEVLFNKLNLKVIKRNKTGPSTDVEVLEKLAVEHRCPKLILEYRSLVKLKNTYLDNLTEYVNPKTKRIHSSFNQIGAATGRLSSSDPNLQNIPIRTDEGRRIRLAFVPGDPAKNVLLTADYSQIELRILAHFTEEPALLRAFEADEDIHRTVAAEVFGVPLDQVSRDQRGQAKTINFGIIYGVSAFGLARRIDGMTVKSAQELINAYNKRFPSIARFLDKCVMEAQSQGYVETLLGRRRPLPEIHSSIVAMRNAAERMAINSVVQGTAADLIKIAMLNVHARLNKEKRPSKMLLQVHDELVFETPIEQVETDAAIIREEMTGAMKLKVPLKVEMGWGKNWQEVK
jgi:DNA polymerase-1